jgi:micrococcal nuclease
MLERVFCGAIDANLELVRSGFAWRYNRYSNDPALIAAQADARESRRGLWADPAPVPPWEWRKRIQR